MQLVEQGKLDLDVDVNKYLDFQVPPLDGQPITLRQIMTHRTGFEERIKDLLAFDVPETPLRRRAERQHARAHLPGRHAVGLLELRDRHGRATSSSASRACRSTTTSSATCSRR